MGATSTTGARWVVGGDGAGWRGGSRGAGGPMRGWWRPSCGFALRKKDHAVPSRGGRRGHAVPLTRDRAVFMRQRTPGEGNPSHNAPCVGLLQPPDPALAPPPLARSIMFAVLTPPALLALEFQRHPCRLTALSHCFPSSGLATVPTTFNVRSAPLPTTLTLTRDVAATAADRCRGGTLSVG
jgi:hypothetical protein